MNRLIAFICVQIILIGVLKAQEFLRDLEINPYLNKEQVERKAKHKSADISLPLPFIDDFSDVSGYPNQELWMNRNIFINTNYGINPPSIGVATFDAVDEFGNIYETVNVATSPADTLTSQLINLVNADRQSTYLSFYYQPQGHGNAPENKDSLILNFISKDSVFRVWHANGVSLDTFVKNTLGIDTLLNDTLLFKRVYLKLEDEAYFTDSFQLQFINYANIPSIASRASDRINKDHWHIDYVYLNDGRLPNEESEPDLAFVEPPTSFMKDYSSVPWRHYEKAIVKQYLGVDFHIRNNEDDLRSMDMLTLLVTDVNTGEFKDFYPGQETFSPKSNKFIATRYDKAYLDYNPDVERASFEISGKLDPDKDYDYKPNNHCSRIIDFDDYYAYDDGTAEKAYGVDADRAKVAYKFYNYKGDSLKAVQMYFLRNKEEYAGVQNFTFCVWSDFNGEPGELIYAETGVRPIITDALNEFATIELDTALYIEEGTFYVGWKQNSDLLMSVGYDANTIRRNRIFFNVQSNWYKSEFSGSLMMRPVFGAREFEAPQKSANVALEIKPNPSVGQISILNFDGEEMNGQIQVFDFMGKKLYEQNASTAENINLSHLNNGMYIVTFFPDNNKPRSARLIISK